MRALVRILPGANFFPSFFFTASDAGNIHQQHSMGDAPYVGSRLGDDYIIYKPQITLRYTL